MYLALTGVAQWVENRSANPEGRWFDSSQGTWLGCRPGPWLGGGCEAIDLIHVMDVFLTH